MANAKARIFGKGENKISWISFQDVAKFAVASPDPSARNAVIQLGGPEALSPLEVVQLAQQISGKQFNVEHVPDEVLHTQFDAATDPMQKSFAGLMLALAQKLAILLLEGAGAMVFFLTLYVFEEGIKLTWAHRERAVAALPVEPPVFGIQPLDPF